MKNNLSAGPTLEDLEKLEQTDDQPPTDTDTDNTQPDTDTLETTITWHCPYCDYNNTALTQVRNHITETVEGRHRGTNGLSPTQDIIGTNPDGDEIQRIEGSGKRPDEDHHLDHGEKRTLIINAWLENGKERDIQAFASIIPVSEQYAQRITKQLETGEITTEEYREEMDWDIRNELGERLESYYNEKETTTMSLTTAETDDDELEHGSKKQQIINSWLLDSDLNYTDLDTVLPANKAYIGRIFRDLNNGDITQEEIEEAADLEFQSELKTALENEDVEVTGIPTTTIDTAETEPETEPDTDHPEYQDTLDHATKKARILNSVLVERDFDVDFTNKQIAGAANSSSQYAQKLTKQIKDGEITDEELEADADEEIQEALVEYYADNDIISDSSLDTSDTDDTDDDVELTVDIDLSNEDDPFENVPVSKRDALVNVFVFDSNMSKADAGDLAGASAEYARQTYNGIQDGTYDPTEYLNERIQNTLEQLDASGDLDAFFADEEHDDVESEEHETQDIDTETDDTDDDVEPIATTDTTDTTPTTDSTDTTRTTRTQGDGDTISASEIEDIRETADTLYRQAQYESDGNNKKAEFIAKEIRDRLDDLLETA